MPLAVLTTQTPCGNEDRGTDKEPLPKAFNETALAPFNYKPQ